MSRAGKPSQSQMDAIGKQLDPYYPSDDDNLNEELCRVLSFLQHPQL